jgi:hypothetical protein
MLLVREVYGRDILHYQLCCRAMIPIGTYHRFDFLRLHELRMG